MKRYGLAVYRRDVENWHWEQANSLDGRERERLHALAYDLWLHNAELLTVQDGIEFDFRPLPDEPACTCERYHPLRGYHHEAECPKFAETVALP